MPHKIEAKGSLWKVRLSTGPYSDYSEEHYVISANDEDEARHLFKKFMSETCEDMNPWPKSRPHGLIFEDGERFQYNPFADPDREMEWATDYNYYCHDCVIEKLEVIYVTD